jgi:hypothetical protein
VGLDCKNVLTWESQTPLLVIGCGPRTRKRLKFWDVPITTHGDSPAGTYEVAGVQRLAMPRNGDFPLATLFP